MPKKKKTREQKILADKRRKAFSLPLYSLPLQQLEKPTKQPTIQAKQNVAIATTNYNYLTSDLLKTVIFTTSILVIELIFKYFSRI